MSTDVNANSLSLSQSPVSVDTGHKALCPVS
eukprot:COSAG02_NODE_41872_length_389_cov_0.666667_1_plen_30_part_10